MIKNFEELEVWQKAHELTLMVYKITKDFPPEEKFGLVSDMRRAAVSIENNIAEGFGRRTTKDFINFLYKSFGSLFETRSMTRVGKDLQFINLNQFNELMGKIQSIHMMLNKLISSLENKKHPIL
jgi:four helix bundle protein